MKRLVPFALALALAYVCGCSARVSVLQASAPERDAATADTTLVRAGLWHTCTIESGGLACFGDNGSAQLGLGDSQERSNATRVGTFSDWQSVAAGQQHTCGIRAPGKLYCWGENTVGQLALGDMDARDEPTLVVGFDDFSDLACGGDNCCALRTDHSLYCWGDNLDGAAGQGDNAGARGIVTPTVVLMGTQLKRVSVGTGHSCAIRDDGALFCWGRTMSGKGGSAGMRNAPARDPSQLGTDTDWREIAVGQQHTCGIRGRGDLYCWGRNDFFELGIGSSSPDDTRLYAVPVLVGRDGDWSSVALGDFHSCAIKRDGSLFCFGRAAEGQIGTGSTSTPIALPTAVAPDLRFRLVTLGSLHTCGLDSRGSVYCWGSNSTGQLGLGDTGSRDMPTKLP